MSSSSRTIGFRVQGLGFRVLGLGVSVVTNKDYSVFYHSINSSSHSRNASGSRKGKDGVILVSCSSGSTSTGSIASRSLSWFLWEPKGPSTQAIEFET